MDYALKKKTTNFIKLEKGPQLSTKFKYDSGFYFIVKNPKKWIISSGVGVSDNNFLKKYKDHSIANLAITGSFNENFVRKYLKNYLNLVIFDETFTYGGLFSHISTILSIVNDKKMKNRTFNNIFIQQKYDRRNLKKKYGII